MFGFFESVYFKVKVKDLSVGDKIKGLGRVTDKYRLYSNYRIWCNYKSYTMEPETMVWVKSE